MIHFSNSIKNAVFIVAIVLLSAVSFGQPPQVSYIDPFPVANAPVDIINAGDGSNRLFIVEQNGVVEVRNGTTLTNFANFGAGGANIISYSAGGERGLLSMAFHPDYNGTTNRYFFIYYTDAAGNIAVTRYQTRTDNIDSVDAASATSIIVVPHPGASNHNGGKLNFGNDGYLYFATGDGGGGNDVPNNAQNGSELLGKMLRIDINNTSVTYGNYAVPADNPYVSDPQVDDRIWALGLRNPFRWSFDRLNGNMWIGDVGQGAQEEINFRAAGSTGHVNYGWRCFEGYISTPGVADCTPVDYVPPVYDYPNPGASSSAVTGGFVYRGTEYPSFPGYYVAADVYSGQIFVIWPNGTGGFDSAVQNSAISFVVGFGEAEDGTLYAASQGTNSIYKVAGVGGVVLPVALTSFNGFAGAGFNELRWATASEQNTARFHVEYSNDAVLGFTRAGSIPASRNLSGSTYDYRHYTDNKGDIFYRLAIEDNNARVSYSDIVRIPGTVRTNIRLYPTIITNSILNIDLNGKTPTSMKLFNTNGLLIYKKDLRNIGTAIISVGLPILAKGIYLVELEGNGVLHRDKIIIQ